MSKLEKAIMAAGQPIRIDSDEFSKSFTFDADFIGFDGHFPDNPILPGVVQLMAGSIAASQAADTPLVIHGVSRTKFLRQITPGERLNVTGRLSTRDKVTLAAIKIFCEEEVAATFTLSLTKDQA